MRSKLVEFTLYQNSIKVKNKIFNEFTIYKLFFEVEKFKKVLFNKVEMEAFDQVKLDFSSLFLETPIRTKKKDLIEQLNKKQEKISQALANLLT